ncbi:MAG: HU family DNA-binding protein [Bacteroides sp.]|nr:HU family DNA-binding protein [Bacteroides sp.]
MNERINTQDLVDLFALRHSVSKKEAEVFIKEFFLLIEQGLDIDGSVKIKGLGTFKLIAIESRESINVNTGERFLIEGHTKVSFTPDNVLRDMINRPFSHFETVVLHENTVLPDTPIESLKEEEGRQEGSVPVEQNVSVVQNPEAEVVPSFAEELSPENVTEAIVVTEVSVSSVEEEVNDAIEIAVSQEITSLSTEEEGSEEVVIGTASVEVPVEDPVMELSQDRMDLEEESIPAEETAVADEEKYEIASMEDMQEQEMPVTPEHEEEPAPSSVPSVSQSFASPSHKRLTAEEIIALEIQKADEEYRRSLKTPFLSRSEKETKEETQEEKVKLPSQKKESNRTMQRYLIAVVLLVLLSCGGLLLYYYMPDWMEQSTEDRLALKNPMEDPETIGWQEDAVEEENSQDPTEGDISNVEQAVEQTEEVSPVNERTDPAPGREAPVRQEQSVASQQATGTSPVSDMVHTVPENIASIPVRPDSVNYVIVGTKTTHNIEEGETLTKIAYRFYGTKDLWPYIVMHNQTVIRNPNHVPFGTTIRIPELEKK